MPVKLSDARSDSFLAKHGDQSVELDALEPNLFQRMVAKSIEENIIVRKWNAKLRKIDDLQKWIKIKLEDIEKIIETNVDPL
jgi:molecular chaperone DnaK (HSP70)